MCNFASFVVHKNGNVYWLPCNDSHAQIAEHANLNDSMSEFLPRPFAYVEIIPVQDQNPENWDFILDERTEPKWFNSTHKSACFTALKDKLNAEKNYKVVHDDGSWEEHFKINGKYHRINGPALTIVNADGSWEEEWYKNGSRYRDGDLPGVIYADGTQFLV